MRLYVYYRVAPAQAEPALSAFLQARGPASVELLRRPALRDGLQTWMEVYPDCDSEAQQAAQTAIAKALQPFLAGPRHPEHFEALTAP